MPATQEVTQYASLNPKRKDEIRADARWQNLMECISQTWQYIGPDAIQACLEGGEREPNKATRLETVLDANYMSTNCGNRGKEAEAFVEELDKKYGYVALTKFLTKEAFI